MKFRETLGGGGTSLLPGNERTLPGGGILCWRFRVALEVLIITKYLKHWFSAAGGLLDPLPHQETFGHVWKHDWFITVGGWVATAVSWVKDFSRQLNVQQCTRHPPQQNGSWPQMPTVPRLRSPGLKRHEHPTLGEMVSPSLAWCEIPRSGALAVWPGGLCRRQHLTQEFLALCIWAALIKS